MMNVIERTQVPDGSLPVARLRDHLRLGTGFPDDGLQDSLLVGFLRAALAAIEARTGKALLSREFEWALTRYTDDSAEPFPIAPVSALHQTDFVGPTGEAEDFLARVYLSADRNRPSLMPVGGELPPIASGAYVRVRFAAGFAPSFDELPADLAQAVLLLAAHYYEYRDETSLVSGCLPFGVTALIERYRPLRLSLGGTG